jgi:hypothetical protein
LITASVPLDAFKGTISLGKGTEGKSSRASKRSGDIPVTGRAVIRNKKIKINN